MNKVLFWQSAVTHRCFWEELWRKDASGQVTIIAFMQLALVCVCFLQMQHFEQVITEQTEEMSWQLCVSTHEVDLFIFPRRGIWGADISTFTRWPRKLSLMMPKAIWLKQTVQTAESTAEHIRSQPETCRNFHTAFIWSKIPTATALLWNIIVILNNCFLF